MKDIFKNWKSLGVGGAIGATLVVVGEVVFRAIKKKQYDEIDSFEEIPSDEETQKED